LTNRQDNVSLKLICQILNEIKPSYYKYQPQGVAKNNNYKLYYDITVTTDQTNMANRSNMLLYNTEAKIFLTDAEIPLSSNIKNAYGKM
jgi:hypothetical protein